MKVDTINLNPAMVELLSNPYQQIPMDANIFMPPDRSRIMGKGPRFDFSTYTKYFLNPLFRTFPYLSIHEAVYDELAVISEIKRFVDDKISNNLLILLRDRGLNEEEQIVRSTIEEKIAGWTEYSPKLDNKDDRGEVKTLSHVAVKSLLYFCSHDAKALRLVDDAEILETNLENVQTIKLYEIIFYLIQKGNLSKNETKAMKALYKYQYHLTNSEKQVNPEWGVLKNQLDLLYSFLLIDAET